ncbi:ArsR/SmtB family transcription factor [Mycobacterium sp. THU-M104]
MKVLHEAGLVTRERRGSWVFYRICEKRLAEARRVVGPTSPGATT